MNVGLLTNAAALTAVVTLLVSLLAPFVEAVPAFADTPANKRLHDAALRLLNVALNILVVFAFTASTSDLQLADVLPLLMQSLAQAAGAHFAYQVVTGGPTATTPAGSALATDTSAGDVPPGAPSVEALGLPAA